MTRRTFVSTAATGRSYAKLATAPAVYGPTPGSATSARGSLGSFPACSRTTVLASACRLRARA